mmetsp:Transcript_60087/g.183550  ORF Transcript_60087/g.183550 Transcript_60087/m.183550 type:complete len:330 (-) Transcript_60087:57-1046(-)
MSAIVGLSMFPHGKQFSKTHCTPPHSKPKISVLLAMRSPSDRFQNSASAWLTRATCFGFNGSSTRSFSRSWAKLSPSRFPQSGFSSSSKSLRGFTRSASGSWSFATAPSSGTSETTTTTVSVYGTHMYRTWRYVCKRRSWSFRSSSTVVQYVRSCRAYFGMHLSVTSATTPRVPKPTRAHRKRSAVGPVLLSSSVPRPGVTRDIRVTISSTVGMRAPVPCALVCVHPAICCSVIELKFSSVRSYFCNSSKICDTRAPASTVMVCSFSSTCNTLSIWLMESIPRGSRASPLGDRPVPMGRSLRRAPEAQPTSFSRSCRDSGANTHSAVTW